MTIFRRRRCATSMKKFYNWFHRFYNGVERYLDSILDQVLQQKIPELGNTKEQTALDFACGSGLLTLKLVPFFKTVVGKDQSQGMLQRAKKRACQSGVQVQFEEGNLLKIEDQAASVDWVFLSFALHLFEPKVQVQLIENLFRIAIKGVVIIDHSQNWRFRTAVIEWLEGSWYDQFVKMDFESIASQIGAAKFEQCDIAQSTVCIFTKAIE